MITVGAQIIPKIQIFWLGRQVYIFFNALVRLIGFGWFGHVELNCGWYPLTLSKTSQQFCKTYTLVPGWAWQTLNTNTTNKWITSVIEILSFYSSKTFSTITKCFTFGVWNITGAAHKNISPALVQIFFSLKHKSSLLIIPSKLSRCGLSEHKQETPLRC